MAAARGWQWTSRRFIYPRLNLPPAITYVNFSPAAADAKLRSRCFGGYGVAVSPAQVVIRFGLFELDPAAGQLTRQGANLRLPQQPMQLLAMLLERPGGSLTREELRQRLWPSDVFLDFDHGLNKSIQKIRDALGDSAASPRYIETIPRVGYRFIAPVSGNKLAAVIVEHPAAAPAPTPATQAGSPKLRWWMLAVAAAAVCALAGLYFSSRPHPPYVRYTKLTDFTDSAGSPAISPDGKILAFIRGGESSCLPMPFT